MKALFAIAQQFPRKQKTIVVCEVQMVAKGRQHEAKGKRVQVLLLWQATSYLWVHMCRFVLLMFVGYNRLILKSM